MKTVEQRLRSLAREPDERPVAVTFPVTLAAPLEAYVPRDDATPWAAWMPSDGDRVLLGIGTSSHAPIAFAYGRFDPTVEVGDDPAWQGTPASLVYRPRWCFERVGEVTTLRWSGTVGELHDRPWESLPSPRAIGDGPSRVTASPDANDDREAWEQRVRAALSSMREGRFEKLVTGRRVALRADAAWDPATVLWRLRDAVEGRPGAVRFAMHLARGAVFVGATPETLVAKRGATVAADGLAGSVPRGEGGDTARSFALLASAKDRREHALVVDFVRDALRPFCTALDVPASPIVRALPTVLHLWTPIQGTLDPARAVTVAALAEAMHPTPAVAGVPRDEAVRWIAAHEPFPRGGFAGRVGCYDEQGDGAFMVGLRSAVLRGDRAWAWAGAGLVEGSDPSMEWDETEAKLGTMLHALTGR